MAHAPDKDDPFPKPRGGGKGGNKGGRGNGYNVPNVLGPGGVANLAEDMAEEFGGTESAWRKDIRQPIKSNFNWGSGGNGGGKGGKDGPGSMPVDPGKPFPNGPDTYGPRRAAAPRGLFDAAPQAAQAPSRGLLSQAVPNVPQTQQAPQQAQQAQLPPEILAWMRANQMRR